MPDKNSPFWSILRLVVVLVGGAVIVSTGYRQGWVTHADLPVILKFGSLVLGVDGLRYFLTKEKKDES